MIIEEEVGPTIHFQAKLIKKCKVFIHARSNRLVVENM
jgi:hypothetical protein